MPKGREVDACQKAGLDADEIVRELRDAESTPTRSRWRTPPELCRFIVENYHESLRRDVPTLIEAARKVERVHAEKPDVPRGLVAELAAFWAEMQPHRMREENVLFPLLSRGALGAQVAMPILVLQGEHDEHAVQLANIRKLTGDLQIPAHACATWKALYRSLALLEGELVHHIYLENNVLLRVG